MQEKRKYIWLEGGKQSRKERGNSRRKNPSQLEKEEIISWIQIIVGSGYHRPGHQQLYHSQQPCATGSMESSIMSKSRVIGSRLAYLTSDPERGDVVIFHFPDDPTGKIYYVKRVIGLRRGL
ncbi:MAG: S26 family signal peptidase [Enterocloster clostridioformis]